MSGVAAINAAKILAEVGDVRRFRTKHHFASYTGTAPIDVSSGDNNRHRLNRGRNRRLNHALHIAAVVQVRMPCPGQDYYQRKRKAGKNHLWKRCAASNGASPTPSIDASSTTSQQRVREGKRGRLFNPARLAKSPRPALRSSYFPDSTPTLRPPPQPRLDTEGNHYRSITRPARMRRGSSTTGMPGSADSPRASPPTVPGDRAR